MKKLVPFLYSITMLLWLAACNSGAVIHDPNEVLPLFFEKLAKKDIDGAAQYVTNDSKATLEMIKKGLEIAERMKDSLPDNDPTEDFRDVVMEPARIMGDSAFIKVRHKKKDVPPTDFKLIKQKDGWKVDFSMSTLMRMGSQSLQHPEEVVPDISEMDIERMQQEREKADSILRNVDPKVLEEIQKNLEQLK